MQKIDLTLYRTLVGPDHADVPSYGLDVLAWKRMQKRWRPGLYKGTMGTLDAFYNRAAVNGTMVMQRTWGLKVTGKVDPPTFKRALAALRNEGETEPHESAWDPLAVSLWMKAKPAIPMRRCFIFPQSVHTYSLGGVRDHMRRPLGNWQSDNAIDEHAAPHSIVVSPKWGYISKGGGYDPHRGPVATIFGEHTTIEFDDGTALFLTHLDRLADVGERVIAGEIIGKVGDWPHSETMDHAHAGARGFNPEEMRKWPRVRIPFSD